MIRGLTIILTGLLIGAGAFFVIKEHDLPHSQHSFAHDGNSRLPELEWLRQKLQLTDKQFEEIAKTHEAYRPTCEALCMKVMASHAKIKKLTSTDRPVTPELEEALKEHALLHVECQKAMLNHLHNTASQMTPEQARTYLEALLPQVIELPLEPDERPHTHQ